MSFPPHHRHKADQEWEVAGLARQDGDRKASEEHTRRARLWEQGIDPDVKEESDDYLTPDWSERRRVHNWKNYINQAVRDIWNSFTPEQKKILSDNAQDQAEKEEWD